MIQRISFASRPIIGLCGPKQSGKSTAAEYLRRQYNFQRLRFSGPLKSMLYALGLTEREIEGDKKEEPCALLCGQTPRHAMVSLGTEWGRDMIAPHFWTNAWRTALDRLQATQAVVAEDCRFPNEAALIEKLGGLTIYIVRPGMEIGTHPSEQFKFKPGFVINNCGTVETLYRTIDQALLTNFQGVFEWMR